MIEDEDIEIEDTQREDRHDLMMRLLMWRENTSMNTISF